MGAAGVALNCRRVTPIPPIPPLPRLFLREEKLEKLSEVPELMELPSPDADFTKEIEFFDQAKN